MDRGVNLGNWLVLEKWMSPELFGGTSAEDESHLWSELDPIASRERFGVHRDSYITDRDFAYLAARGIDFVRLPVPYFVFGDVEPYIGCIDYIDRAFQWGQRYGVRILLDLHTVPESQNGFDNGGICGVCKFHKDPAHAALAVDVLARLARRYAAHPSLWGIEVLNEPVSPELWKLLDVPKRYPAVDKEQAEGSEAVPTEFLQDYYQQAYTAIRAQAPDARVVFHDGFRIREWPDFFTGDRFENFIVDTHMYVMMGRISGEKDLDEYVTYIDQEFGGTLREMSTRFPIMVGEWNLDTKSTEANQLPDEERRRYYASIAAAHFAAFEPAVAWCFWSYKQHADDHELDMWDLLKAVELGFMPPDLAGTPTTGR